MPKCGVNRRTATAHRHATSLAPFRAQQQGCVGITRVVVNSLSDATWGMCWSNLRSFPHLARSSDLVFPKPCTCGRVLNSLIVRQSGTSRTIMDGFGKEQHTRAYGDSGVKLADVMSRPGTHLKILSSCSISLEPGNSGFCVTIS